MSHRLLVLRVPRHRLVRVVAMLLAVVFSASAASAQTQAATHRADRGRGEPVEWTWRRFGAGDIALTSAGAVLAITAIAIGPTETTTSNPTLGIDESVRDALRPSSFAARSGWRDTSDVLLTLNVSYPLFGDALVNAAWYRDSPDVGRQLALIDAEAFVITLGVQQAFANFVGRQRPHGAVCGTEELPDNTAACEVRDRYRSYFSGHTSLSFTAAALTCTHHRHLELHGGRAEWAPCLAGVLLASGTGAMRIAGDRHYFTDVATGAVMGSLIGWAVPFVHYRSPRRSREARPGSRSDAPRFIVLPSANGFLLSGAF